MSESTPPPGWHEDPYGTPGLLRWWDGRQWTQKTTPAQTPAAYGPPPPVYAPPGPLYGPPPTAKRSRALPWVLTGSALVVVAAVVIAAVFVFGGDDAGGDGSTGGKRSPVTGTITDTTAGITYARLGAPWTPADSGWLRPNLYSAGEVSVVQAPFEQSASFNATNLSGVPRQDESAGYSGPQDLVDVDQRVTSRILREHFTMFNRRTTLVSAARTVDGHKAWLERFRLDFPDAKEQGWKFSADTIAILVVDVGGGHLAELWVSIPDTFVNQGDLDQVLDSVKVSS